MKPNQIFASPIKQRFYLWIILVGVLAGSVITLLAWLQKWTPLVAPHGLYAILFWVGVAAVISLGIFFKRQYVNLSRLWMLLSVLTAIGMVWLFPETLAPGCAGMPRVLAHWEEDCTTTCTTVCTWWVPLSDPTCAAQPHQPWDIGCCWAYGESCTTSCSNIWVDDPPTVDGSVTCSSPGNNGWCRGSAALDLSASDPQGYALTISGDISGTPFSCSGSCSQFIPEGIGSATFSVVASGGGNLSSASNSVSYQVDSTAPSLALDIPAPNGSNGWFTSLPVSASASATDAVSGVASVSINGGGSIFSSYEDGIYSLTATASDNAGNEATTRGTIQIDSTPPSLSISVSHPDGSNGWYVSPAVVNATASDATSGIAGVQFRLDGGSWQAGSEITVTEDGMHTVEFQAWDQTGNLTTTSQVVQMDTLPPVSQFTYPVEGSTSIVSGTTTFNGISQDTASGLAEVQISLDEGQTWHALTPDSIGQWAYTWDTSAIPNGTYTIYARGQDLAGNQEHTAQVTVVVSNEPPDVSITPFFSIWQTASLTIRPHLLPIGGARLTISDPLDRWPPFVQEFDVSSIPESFIWGRTFGDGSVAPAGEYPITLEAWDINGNTGRDQGWITVFAPSPPTPTPSLTVTSSSPVRDPTLQPTGISPMLSQIATPEAPLSPSRSAMLWSAFGLIGLFAVLASASLSDPRPRAIDRLKKTLETFQKRTK